MQMGEGRREIKLGVGSAGDRVGREKEETQRCPGGEKGLSTPHACNSKKGWKGRLGMPQARAGWVLSIQLLGGSGGQEGFY